MDKVTLLIDGDVLAYVVASINQKTFEFDGEKAISVTEDEHQLILDLWNYINGYKEVLEATDYRICLSDSTNWRHKVLKSYKSNRDDKDKPVLLSKIRELIKQHHPVLMLDNLEADDVMGIYSTHPDLIEGKKIIVSIDKDMRTIPGWLYNPNIGELEYITEEEADRWHMTQTITGDTVDGYSGCPGAGPTAAQEALEGKSASELWEGVLSVYYKKAVKDALQQAQVANILRHDQYNFKTGKVKPWKPLAT